ncbi:SDR family NAD(P)-dependent oxidoreductase [Mesorhizobium sp. B2-4-8]|uniref:SDR family oxidoreductase n=1 Tax=Mesorhizobium sp. B2-4-8 TaxID=2589941 RepID=UPI001126B0F4|nr:SDR family NAD(P)-dependent oxidoreductase [Mesorhizobium sp. B2-4-8]TPL35532.1 SDR family NAD(P)-dependent oxidoreductase [Mesorhizobium sp. B2-4-8]
MNNPANRRLTGRVALVTGASSGIGEATALTLAAEGARVVIAARRMQRLIDLADRIRQSGGEARPIEADVTNETQASNMVRDTLEAFGRLDLLLNVAGIGVAAPFQNTTTAEYRQMVDVNFLGLLYPIHAALPAMKRQGNGHIVIVSSGTGRYIHPSTVYSGTKHAASAMAESLRREIGKDWIRVTSIEPGAVRTEFTSHMRDEVRASVEQRLGDMVQLESDDVAAAILYAVTQPPHVNVNILTIYPTQQP